MSACLALGLAAGLTGCSADPSKTLKSVQPSAVNAPSEQADQLVQRARKLYVDYLLATQTVAEKGAVTFDRLKPLLSSAAYKAEIDAFKSQENRGIRTAGPSRLMRFRAQRVDARLGEVVAYACVDVSKVRVVNKAGKDVTPTSRPDRQTLLPSFRTERGRLVLEENGTWSGDSIC
jgi:hypothetical protein